MKSVRTSVGAVTLCCLLLLTLPAGAGAGGAKGPSLEGSWLGSLKVSPTDSLRLVFNIRANPDGSFSGTLDSPDQGVTGVAITRISVEKGQVKVEISVVNGGFEGTLNTEGSEMTGQWKQGSAALDLVMKRVKEAPKIVRPQEPKKPYPYIEEEVTYRNEQDNLGSQTQKDAFGDPFKLAGTLTMPRTGQPFPAVILITGSGQQDRDEALFGHRPFLILADYLSRRGIAVLRVDDRGVGGSGGDFSQATTADFARDVLAGVAYLKTRKEIDPKRIGLLGHSEGGNIAPIAATQSSDVAFIILMAGTGIKGDAILESQIATILKMQGADQATIEAALQSQRRVVDIVTHETDPNVAQDKVRKIIEEALASLDEQRKQALKNSGEVVDTQVRMATSKWLRYFVTHDPKETLRKVKCPVLALNGALDKQVPPQLNLPAIEQALREGGNPHFTVQELPGLNHLFQTAQTGTMDEYGKIEETMSPAALETVAQWIETQTKKK